MYGRLCACAGVPRFPLFEYALLWQLTELFAALGTVAPAPRYTNADADRQDLLLRLVGRCSLESIACRCAELGLPVFGGGQFATADDVCAGLAAGIAGIKLVVVLADEIFTAGQPILLTIEPRSLTIWRSSS